MGPGRQLDREAVVFFHAHPDDEAIFTGGTIARLAAAGHRVVLIVATRGEQGARTSSAGADEDLARQREEETRRAADLLGLARVEFLDYHDSGMLGDPANSAPGAFWGADVHEAARSVADLLGGERARALITYDQVGIYGHPDHVQVHRVGHLAAQLAGADRVY